MTTRAEIINQSVTKHNASFELFLPATLIHFDGHFPRFPVLPGLVQIQWAVEFAEIITKRNDIAQVARLKFTGLVFPNSNLRLDIDYNQPGNMAIFCYHANGKKYSQGQLHYRERAALV